MKYSIDKIEEDIILLEDVNTKEKVEVNIKLLPKNIKEGSILLYQDNKYILDEQEEQIRRINLKNRFDRLKK